MARIPSRLQPILARFPKFGLGYDVGQRRLVETLWFLLAKMPQLIGLVVTGS